MVFADRGRYGGKAGMGHQAGVGGAVDLFQGLATSPVVRLNGELLAELAQAGLFVAGQDAVGEAFAHGLAPSLGDGGADAIMVHVRAAGDDGQVVDERAFVEVGPAGGFNNHLHHLLVPGTVVVVAFLMAAAEEAGLLTAVSTVAHDVRLCGQFFRLAAT